MNRTLRCFGPGGCDKNSRALKALWEEQAGNPRWAGDKLRVKSFPVKSFISKRWAHSGCLSFHRLRSVCARGSHCGSCRFSNWWSRLPDLSVTRGTLQISFLSRPGDSNPVGLTKGPEFKNLCSNSHSFRRPGWPRFGGLVVNPGIAGGGGRDRLWSGTCAFRDLQVGQGRGHLPPLSCPRPFGVRSGSGPEGIPGAGRVTRTPCPGPVIAYLPAERPQTPSRLGRAWGGARGGRGRRPSAAEAAAERWQQRPAGSAQPGRAGCRAARTGSEAGGGRGPRGEEPRSATDTGALGAARRLPGMGWSGGWTVSLASFARFILHTICGGERH